MARPPPSNSSSGSATPAAGSNAPTPASSSAGRPPANAQAKPPDPMNLPHMIQMDKEGKLQPKQVQMLREMIYRQCRHVVASAVIRGQPNPMTNLPAHLIPYSNINGHNAICTKQQWDAAIASGYADAKRVGEIMSMTEIKGLLAFSQEERAKKLAADPVLKIRFTRALAHYAQQTRANAGQAAAPVAPAAQKMETEDVRRKRKLAEMLSDEGGGIQAELGVHEVLGEALDSFVETEALKAMRVAKHRKSARVELKDMAFAIHDSTGITVPGYNVLPRDRVHTASDGDKKKRTVVPLKPRGKKDDA